MTYKPQTYIGLVRSATSMTQRGKEIMNFNALIVVKFTKSQICSHATYIKN